MYYMYVPDWPSRSNLYRLHWIGEQKMFRNSSPLNSQKQTACFTKGSGSKYHKFSVSHVILIHLKMEEKNNYDYSF